MMNIVVAVNEYNTSGTATEWISEFLKSKSISGTVHFVYCISEETEMQEDTFTTDVRSSDDGDSVVAEHAELAEAYGVDSEAHIVHAETPEDGILSVAEEVQPEFIVTGHRPHTSKHNSVYSTAQNLLRKSPVPVTVVSSRCDSNSAPSA